MRWLRKRSRPSLPTEFRRRARSAPAAWVLLAVSCALVADLAWSYADVNRRIERATQRLARLPAARMPAQQALAYQPKDAEREAAFARSVITRISLPWNELFKALGAAQVAEVQLLGVEPDPEARTVRITAEARDIPAMLTYVARLESQGYFRSVGLLQHELKREAGAAAGPPRGARTAPRPGPVNPNAPVSFVVAASWKQR